MNIREAIMWRKKPARRFSGPEAPSALLHEVRSYDIQTAFTHHQISAGAVAFAAVGGHIQFEALIAAEEFRLALCRKTGWEQPLTFLDLAKRVPRPERTDRTIDLGFIWRLFIVKYCADIWTSAPTLAEFRKDVAAVQQAALYVPEVLGPLLRRMATKYDEGLWIVGEHYNSWRALTPAPFWSWEKLLPENWDGSRDWRPSRRLRKWVDHDCQHILHEIDLHQQAASNRGATGNAVLAKVVEECWHQWRWNGRENPLARGQFARFQQFVGACMDLVAPEDGPKGSPNTLRRYLSILVEQHDGARAPWNSPKDRISGSKRTERVLGHSLTVYPRRREFMVPILKIRLKAFWNLVRGYPATWDNHNRIF